MFKILFYLLIISCLFCCKTASLKKGDYAGSHYACCIDTFKIKQIKRPFGKVEVTDEKLYVGVLKDEYIINGKRYKKLVFGDSITSVRAFIRQDDEGLYYISTYEDDKKTEDTLLHFNRKVDYKWSVDIGYSLFWKQEIKFGGLEHTSNGDQYIYNLEHQGGYFSPGNNMLKIVFSKERGFLSFVIQTHWITDKAEKSQ